MSGRGHTAALAALLAAGLALALGLWAERVKPPLGTTLAPFFEIIGLPVQSLDRLVARVVPVDALDEGDLGRVLRERYEARARLDDRDFVYLNDLMSHVSQRRSKPFDYRVYVVPSKTPNAMALPGGVIRVTSGLLSTLGSESELVAVLAHELGHVELSHCFNAVKFSLLARKLGPEPLGEIADLAVRLLIGHSFSKTQEAEADEYAYALVLNSRYQPLAVGRAFESLLAWERAAGRGATPSRADPFRDYFRSHPPLELRRDEFLGRAERWLRTHPGEQRYVGSINLEQRTSLGSGLQLPSEWTTATPRASRAEPDRRRAGHLDESDLPAARGVAGRVGLTSSSGISAAYRA